MGNAVSQLAKLQNELKHLHQVEQNYEAYKRAAVAQRQRLEEKLDAVSAERDEFRTEVIRQGSQVVAANARADQLRRQVEQVERCTCPWVDPKYWTTHYGAVEPGSTQEYDPTCPIHGALRRQVDAVRALHNNRGYSGTELCDGCREKWPCLTIRALDGAEGGAGDDA